MKQWLLIILAMGALIIGYRQLIMEKFLGWFVTHDAIRVTAALVKKALIPHVVRGRGQLQAVEVVDVVSPVAGQLSKVQLKAGKYAIYCTVDSHAAQGMVATITVAP